MNVFLRDPVTGQPSVSLTLMIVSFLFLLVASGLEMAGVVKSTSMAFEMFGSTAALYFSRRLKLGKKSFSSEETKKGNE